VTVDVTYVDNAADAHLNAADRIADCAGKGYFISNGEPVLLWDFLNRILTDAGLSPVTRSLPTALAKIGAFALEKSYRLLRLSAEPPTTRFVVSQLSTSHWYDISAAKRDLGYAPAVSVEEGLRRLAESFRAGG
jgi:nucleoside-diphosphate-sugar epimerase